MKKQRKWMQAAAGIVMSVLMLVSAFPVQAQSSTPDILGDVNSVKLYTDTLTPIMGSTTTDIGQMINYYESNATYPAFYASSDAPTIYDFCRIYVEECEAEGVRAEVAFCQAMKETGFLRFGGRVDISQYNFAGIGATDSGAPPNTFSSVREGVRGQVQHLKAYASIEPLKNPIVVDPRYRYVKKGCAPYVEWLGQNENPNINPTTGKGYGWATSPGYGYSIVNDYMAKLSTYSTYTTWYNGVNYAAIYNPTYYLKVNPDLASLGGDGDQLIAHFVNHGMNEGRSGSSEFDVRSYMNQYVDLRNGFGNNLRSYYLHYLNYGKAEGRKGTGCNTLQGYVTVYNGVDYSAVYNYNYYISMYGDIARAYAGDDIKTLAHFVNNGMSEGRQGSAEFNVNSYRNQYGDLRRGFGNNLKAYYLHYMNSGKAEGRKGTGCNSLQGALTIYNGVDYSAVYNYDYYTKAYGDIANAYGGDDVAVLAHFVNHGMSEGRQGSAEFNVNSYRNQYGDLRRGFGNNLKAYYLHYINSGKSEGRKGTGCNSLQGALTVYNGVDYSAVYAYDYYIKAYGDIARAYGGDDVAVLAHFVNHGMSEGRQGNAGFNVYAYKNRYADLQNAFGDNLKEYYMHYINYGKKEGRNGI
ncbi:MAG: glucosaminidase domain-containing protein [Lachnospiraceae bacterium]|nr:glucosaminidase domain-containing protein [Lachnospiraceae bacterium]MDD7378686.1 glucosaminidase domain-containing protein [Lachnospiraceae bacterium]MDY4617747.1 glucosaminidase domain-containing protein [Lachnospiraceae bacterium]